MPYNLALGTQWPTAIRRAFGIREGAVQVVSPEIQPSFDVWGRPEWWALAGGDLGAASGALSASAINFSVILFANPLLSGVVDIIDEVIVTNGSADIVSIFMGLNPALGTLLGNGGRTDTRRIGTAAVPTLSTSLQVRTLQQVASLSINVSLGRRVRGGANVPIAVRGEWVLGPGGILICQSGAINEGLDASISFRERQATADEISATNSL